MLPEHILDFCSKILPGHHHLHLQFFHLRYQGTARSLSKLTLCGSLALHCFTNILNRPHWFIIKILFSNTTLNFFLYFSLLTTRQNQILNKLNFQLIHNYTWTVGCDTQKQTSLMFPKEPSLAWQYTMLQYSIHSPISRRLFYVSLSQVKLQNFLPFSLYLPIISSYFTEEVEEIWRNIILLLNRVILCHGTHCLPFHKNEWVDCILFLWEKFCFLAQSHCAHHCKWCFQIISSSSVQNNYPAISHSHPSKCSKNLGCQVCKWYGMLLWCIDVLLFAFHNL